MRYPSVMLVSGGSDGRAAPLHAFKMTAALQAATGSSDPVVLLSGNHAGGKGAPSASSTIEALVAELRFMLWKTR